MPSALMLGSSVGTAGSITAPMEATYRTGRTTASSPSHALCGSAGRDATLVLVHRLAYNGDVAAGQLAVFTLGLGLRRSVFWVEPQPIIFHCNEAHIIVKMSACREPLDFFNDFIT